MRILIVEDDRAIAENLYEYLESRGHQCDYAHTLAAATLLLQGGSFDAAILDRNLPDGDGIGLARRLRTAGNALPLLILTARDTLEYDGSAQEVRLAGQPLRLPPKALKLVAELLPHPNRVFSRRELEIAIWGHEQESSDNLRSVLHTLRRALGEESGIQVVNVHGLGYKLVCA